MKTVLLAVIAVLVIFAGYSGAQETQSFAIEQLQAMKNPDTEPIAETSAIPKKTDLEKLTEKIQAGEKEIEKLKNIVNSLGGKIYNLQDSVGQLKAEFKMNSKIRAYWFSPFKGNSVTLNNQQKKELKSFEARTRNAKLLRMMLVYSEDINLCDARKLAIIEYLISLKGGPEFRDPETNKKLGDYFQPNYGYENFGDKKENNNRFVFFEKLN